MLNRPVRPRLEEPRAVGPKRDADKQRYERIVHVEKVSDERGDEVENEKVAGECGTHGVEPYLRC